MFSTPDGAETLRAAVEQTLRRSEEQHRTSTLPRLGLPATWTGERQTGASSVHRSFSGEDVDRSTATPDRQWETVELIHGVYPNGPWLAVATDDTPDGAVTSSLVSILRDEIEAVTPNSGTTPPPAGTPPQNEFPATTTTVQVRVDGELIVLSGVTFAGLTVARATLDGWTLTVKSRNWPHEEPIELTRLVDVEPYLTGRREAVLRAMKM
jgi:hypothetical protein